MWIAFCFLSFDLISLTFMSSTKEGNPPIDMKVTNPKTKAAQDPLDCPSRNQGGSRKEEKTEYTSISRWFIRTNH